MKRIIILIILICFFCCSLLKAQDPLRFDLDIRTKGAEIQPTMYGLFFEDINFGADGGLYAELVKNRSFDFPQKLMGWKTFGKVEVLNSNPLFENNPTYLKLSSSGHNHKHTGIENEGFRGMGFKKGEQYNFSVWAKSDNINPQKLRINLVNSKNDVIGSQDLEITDQNWERYEIKIISNDTDKNGRLRIFLLSQGDIYLEHVSLFPNDTWKGRKSGLRKDLAQALADLHPGVFRFPGGCIVEGTDLETRYDWKKSIGPVENRPLNENRWHYTFMHRFFPDYFQSYGLGFYEYFLLSEDIGAEPLPVINVGLACQYQNECCKAHQPIGELDDYIQDALDLIEFANGNSDTKWGKIRAEMGHPAPFDMKYLGIGNEQWGTEYVERLAEFCKVLRKKHPQIKLIGSSGPSADGKEFDYLWPEMKRLKVDLVDEHYYQTPEWFLNNASRYDNYDRKGPAVFAGEYACHDYTEDKNNNFLSALCEAAFMTGLERNADIVQMCTYAPLFAHVDAWQWKPDMIWFDNLSILKTPNYFVQQLFAINMGTNVLNITWNKQPITGQNQIYSSAVYDKNEKCYIIKVVNTGNDDKEIQIVIKGLKDDQILSIAECITLQNDDLKAINTWENKNHIVPQTITASIEKNIVNISSQPKSFSVYKILE